MSKNLMSKNLVDFGTSLGLSSPKKKKRKPLTASEKIYIWERPKKYGRKCNICQEKITKLSDLESDHKRAYSKGGTTLALAHKDCNRRKGSGTLGQMHKRLGIKSKTKKKKTRKARKVREPTLQNLRNPFPKKTRKDILW